MVNNLFNNSLIGNQQNNNQFSNKVNDIFGTTNKIGSLYNTFQGASNPYLSFGTGLLNGLDKEFNSKEKYWGGFGNGLQGFFGVDSERDSDVMQGVNGTLNGAIKGTMIFPGIGTAVGALLGLGSSFIDDIK